MLCTPAMGRSYSDDLRRNASTEAHVVQFATHGAQVGFDVAKTLAVGQLLKIHSQMLVAAREAPMRISAITLDALLELVGRQGIQELGENGLSSIHPTLSTISVVGCRSPIAVDAARVNFFKSKNESYKLSLCYVMVIAYVAILAVHYCTHTYFQ